MSGVTARQRFLFAVDPSLTCSGWALFACADGAPLATGTLTPPGPQQQLSERLTVVQQEISKLYKKLRMGEGDVVVCEGPAPLVLNPSSAVKVEQVRSIFESVARERGVLVPGRVNPRTVQTELLGLRGKQLSRSIVKDTARAVVRNLYGPSLEILPVYGSGKELEVMPQDIIDALLVGTLALSRIRVAEQSNRPLHEAFISKQDGKSLSRSRRSPRWSEDDLHVAERVPK